MPEAWRRLALPLAIVIAGGHRSKGLAKIVSWGGFLPLSAKDLLGIDTARAITAETLPRPGERPRSPLPRRSPIQSNPALPGRRRCR